MTPTAIRKATIAVAIILTLILAFSVVATRLWEGAQGLLGLLLLSVRRR